MSENKCACKYLDPMMCAQDRYPTRPFWDPPENEWLSDEPCCCSCHDDGYYQDDDFGEPPTITGAALSAGRDGT